MLSTAPAGGGLAGEMTTGWITSSDWLNELDGNIASDLLKCSDHLTVY